jgi:LuxR family maltose regulon positive regulatory protein
MSTPGITLPASLNEHWAAHATAHRTPLVNRLRAAHSYPVVTLVGPPGYGKSTLLGQWVERDERPFAWVVLDGSERTSGDLLMRVAAALEAIGAATGPRSAARRTERGSRRAELLGRVTGAWAAVGTPSVLVFDNVHLVRQAAAAAVARLIAVTPLGSQVVLAGRALPTLPDPSLPRLRATGRLLELTTRDLALTRREAGAALKAAGLSVTEAMLTELLDETEGWPAGINGAAAMLLGRPPLRRNGAFPHEAMAEFFRDECLATMDPAERLFLRRTAVLGRMTAPLCDAMLATTGSAELLASLEARNAFLVPLDRRGESYRHHRLLRKSLLQELAELEPELVPTLHQRAAEWLEEHGEPAAALHHAHAAGNRGHFIRIFGAAPLWEHARRPEWDIEDWLDNLDDIAALSANPQAAALAARLYAHSGNVNDAERCLDAAAAGLAALPKSNERALAGAKVALVRAALCPDGVDTMLADAERGLELVSGCPDWRPYGLLLQGSALALLGDEERATAILDRAVEAAERFETHDTEVLALTEASLVASQRRSWGEAEAYLLRAFEAAQEHGVEGHPPCALTLALAARNHLRGGHWVEGHWSIAQAQRLLPRLNVALPWLAVQARLELAGAFVMLRDWPATAMVLQEVDAILSLRPGLGRLRGQRDRLMDEAAEIPSGHEGQSARLSRAELRLLPLLGTHLSFREIGTHLFLSRHTVKTQAISAYRKLGASSRREAVSEAARLELIEHPAGAATVS